MGFFGTYLFDGTRWVEPDPGQMPDVDEPWLYMDIHDSDIAGVMYEPAGPGSGEAFLGYTPRTYFEDESASSPTDVVRESEGLAAWWAGLHGETGDAARTAKASELRAFLAEDDAHHEDIPDDELDDADVFVETKAARFICALGLPLPDGLSEPY